jgi:hypothetical protein
MRGRQRPQRVDDDGRRQGGVEGVRGLSRQFRQVAGRFARPGNTRAMSVDREMARGASRG